MVQGPDGWLLRWSPSRSFPELGARRDAAPRPDARSRGRIVGAGRHGLGRDARGRRARLPAGGARRPGHRLRRRGHGRGPRDAGGAMATAPGTWSAAAGSSSAPRTCCAARRAGRWSRSPLDGAESVLYETEMVPGADVAITLRPAIQAPPRSARARTPRRPPRSSIRRSGDVWALASQPAFNPNSMTIGTTFGGRALTPAGRGQIFNKAVLGAYPAGSSFKPFTLAAALKTGVVTPQQPGHLPADVAVQRLHLPQLHGPLRCPGWSASRESMAFSCNTTYMPLAFEVYQADETALTDLLFEFGFGAPTGIGYLVEETGHRPRRRLARRERARRLLRASSRSSSRSGRAPSSARRSSWPTPTPPSATAARSGRRAS